VPTDIVIYDASVEIWMRRLFAVWSRRRESLVLAISSWSEAIDALPDEIGYLQYWGHGDPGAVLCNGQHLPSRLVTEIGRRVDVDSFVWWRTCSSFHGVEGYKLARWLTERAQCIHFAHTYKIGLWQSGCRSIAPGEVPTWSTSEGGRWSTPWAPSTVCATSWLP